MKPKKNGHAIVFRQLSDRLLWLEAKRENGDVQVESGGEVMLQMGEDQSLQDAMSAALKELKSTIEINWFMGCEIILTAPGNLYSARHTCIPNADDDTVREAVAFEVAETLQISADEFLWDEHRSTHQSDEGDIQLIWVAARKSSIAALLSSIPKNTLYPTQITPDFWAVYETLMSRNAALVSEPSIIVYTDGSHLTFLVVDQQAVYFTRSVGTSSTHPAHISQTIQTEIQRLLAYVPDRFNTPAIRNVMLCGLPHLPKDELREFSTQHGLDCIQITLQDVEDVLPIPSGCELKPEHFPLLSVMYAVFHQNMSGIQLLDENEQGNWWETLTSEESLPPKPVLKRVGILAGAVAVLWISQLIWFQYAAASYLKEGEDLLRAANHLKNEETALRSIARTHIDYDELFLFLSETLPENVLVKTLSLDVKSGVDMVLTGGNNQLIQTFVADLNASKFFKDITETRSANESTGFTVYLKGQLKV